MNPRFRSIASVCHQIWSGLAPWLALFSIAAFPLWGQSPPADDFNPGVQGEVYAIAVQPDGKILVGGTFDQMGGQPRRMIARLLPDGTADPGFDPGADRPPLVFAVQPDGKILVGGNFQTLAGQARRGLARLNPDGTLDASFAAETAGDVNALFLLPDGKILVGGGFTQLAGVARANLGRLNPDGTLDASFTVEADGPVGALAMQSDGRLLVGGSFGELGGQPRARLGRLLADGTVDPDFHPELGPPEMANVRALVAQRDGRILVGGEFFEVNGESRDNLVRLNADGSMDPSVDVMIDGFIPALLPQADGGVIVGGGFLTFGMGANVGLGRLMPDGSEDTSFTAWAELTVKVLVEQPDGKILVGGELVRVNQQGRAGIGRLEPVGPVSERLIQAGDTLTWRREGPGMEVWRATFEYSVDGQSWTPLGDGERIDGGWELRGVTLPDGALARVRGEAPGARSFVTAWLGPPMLFDSPEPTTAAFGEAVRFEARAGGSEPLTYQWTRDGQPLTDGDGVRGVATPVLRLSGVTGAAAGEYRLIVRNALGEITSPPATLTVADPLITRQPADQTVQPGGTATFSVEAAGSAPLTYQWRKDGELLADGGRVSGAATPTLTITDAAATDEAVYSIVVGNAFGSVASREASLQVAAVKVDPGFVVEMGSHRVDALALQPDGKILVGGLFQYLAGEQIFGLGRLHPDGRLDRSFSANVGSREVFTVAIQPDGKVVVGGFARLLRLNRDGSEDTGFVGTVNDLVYCVVVQPDGKLLVGGKFTQADGQGRPALARFHPDGSLDASFVPKLIPYPRSQPTIQTIALQPDGKILIGGWFLTDAARPQSHLARLLPDGSVDEGFSADADNWVETIALQADGGILVGGKFTTVNGQPKSRIARLNADGTLDAGFAATANGDVLSFAVQVDGGIVVGGSFTTLNGQGHSYLGRLNADGSVDASFGLGANSGVTAVALQSDGSILVGGAFRSLGEVQRTLIARLRNTAPATQSLEAGDSGLFWRRTGTGPVVTATWFDYSIDGLDWTPLGHGVRQPGGWELSGVSWPRDAVLRARGVAWSGRYGGSSSWVEGYHGRPLILEPPADLAVEAGNAASLVVHAGGSEPLTYQWRKDGIPLAEDEKTTGVHGAILKLTDVWGPAAGEYSVVVSNVFGEIVSPAATLTVTGDPKITRQPASLLVDVGDRAEFGVEAAGTEPLSYQWRKDGVDLPAATEATLVLTNVQTAAAGIYTVVVSGPHGRIESEPALLSVNAVELAADFAEEVLGTVNVLAVQPDGKVLLGGDFRKFGGEWRSHLARAHPDGSVDMDFVSGADGIVQAVALQTDGKILVGGKFSELAGAPRANLGRLNPDGTVDEDFQADTDGEVLSLAIQADGRILVAGAFHTLNGQPRLLVARLNPDGALDHSFDPEAGGLEFVDYGFATCVALQPDGRILVGGQLLRFDPEQRLTLVRLNSDGAPDLTFQSEIDRPITALAVQPDGRILVSGDFGSTGDALPMSLGRLNSDGSWDETFAPKVWGPVWTLQLQTDGKILAGGGFGSVNGELAWSLVRLTGDGRLDVHFRPRVRGDVRALALKPDGSLLVGGVVHEVNGQARRGLAGLRNTAPAVSELRREDARWIWRRDGTAPEVWRTTLEESEDGVEWTLLGEGLRVPGGWEWPAPSMPAGGWLRTRGHLTGAFRNGSGWFVEEYEGAPLILAPPFARQQKAGGQVQFLVHAGGTPPLSYQWLRNGVPLSDGERVTGATTPVLTLSGVSGADAGRLSVRVTNARGSVTSEEAELTVEDPWIVTEPADADAGVGQTISLAVEATGTGPLHYQWLKDGAELPGENGGVLTVRSVEPSDAGYYQVRVSNAYGEVLSRKTLLGVNGVAADPGFTASTDSGVDAMAVQHDGAVLLGGHFHHLNGLPRVGLGRLQPNGLLDAAFLPEVDGWVGALAVGKEGDVLVAGEFGSLGGVSRTALGRVDADGTVNAGFIPQVDGSVWLVEPEPDGNLLVAGDFSEVGGQPRSDLARIRPDGSVDPGFAPQIGDYRSKILALVRQPDGKMVVGGDFRTVNGQPRDYLVRLNSDGSVDESFQGAASDPVLALGLQPDGKVLVAGQFSALGPSGVGRRHLGRLNPDGTLDDAFNPDFSYWVHTLVLQANGKIIAGGSFDRVNGMPRAHLARLNPDGSLDPVFNPGADDFVGALGLQADGKIMVGGYFGRLAGTARVGIGRLLNPDPALQSLVYDGSTLTWLRDGSVPEIDLAVFEHSADGVQWSTLASPVRISGGWELRDLGLPNTGLFRASGLVKGGRGNGSSWVVASYWGFPELLVQPVSLTNQVGTTAVFRVEAEGAEPLTFQWRKDGVDLPGEQSATLTINSVGPEDAGEYRVVVRNAFGSVVSEPAWLIVQGSPGIVVHPVSSIAQVGGEATFSVEATGSAPLSYQWRKDGELLVDGDHVAGATTATLRLSHLTTDLAGAYTVTVSNPFGEVTSAAATLVVNTALVDPNFAGDADSGVVCSVLQPDGRIVVGGTFMRLNGTWRNHLGRLNPDGTLDAGFDPAPNFTVRAMLLLPDGKLLIGGDFTQVGGAPRSGLARIHPDGSLDATFQVDASGPVYALALQADGKVLVGGGFIVLGGIGRSHLARLNADGSLDPGFKCNFDGDVHAIALQPDGQILVGGVFGRVAGSVQPRLARLLSDGRFDGTFVPGIGAGVFSSVHTVLVEPDGQILVGGRFDSLNGQPLKNLARLNSDGSLDAGFTPDPDGEVDTLALQADGGILVGGHFAEVSGQPRVGIARLDATGALDPHFSPGSVGSVWSLTIQADGGILAGGDFFELGGGDVANLGRLLPTGAVVDELTATGSTLSWRREGAGPEVWRTRFEETLDGVSWSALGEGTRTAEGWELTDAQPSAGSTIRARGWVTGGQYNGSSWMTEAYAGAPILLSQPIGGTKDFGTAISFRIAAGGSAPLRYQWRKDGAPLMDGESVQGAQTAELRLTHLSGGDAGDYTVVVSNADGSVTSEAATLVVVDPLITEAPVSQTWGLGQTATFSVVAVGTAPLSYQWWHGDQEIPGATAATLELVNLQASDAGDYRVVVSNRYGEAASPAVTLTLVSEPTILRQPEHLLVAPGESATFRVEAVGIEPLRYQWWKDGAPLSGATGVTLELADVQPADGGRYLVVVSNQAGETVSDEATLTVNLAVPDLAFNPPEAGGPGFVDPGALAIHPDGILLGGYFSSLGGEPRQSLALLNLDGTVSERFAHGVNSGGIHTLAVQPDDRLLVGGVFTELAGGARRDIGRLLPDGSLDAGVEVSPDDAVLATLVQPDGGILIGGRFTKVDGEPRYHIARLRPDGSLDAAFLGRLSGDVWCLTAQPDGKILVGGNFSLIGDEPQAYLGRLNPDGSMDPGFAPRLGGAVNAIALEPDGDVVVARMLARSPEEVLVRLKADGSQDPLFRVRVEGGRGSVASLLLQTDGRMVVGGQFQRVNGVPRLNVARLNPDGSLDPTFAPAVAQQVYSLALQADGGVLIGTWCRTGRPEPCTILSRVSNPDPATQELRYENATVTWLRGGSSPEAWRVTFEHSLDGANWTLLGAPSRIAGGWELAGVSLPNEGVLRARAYLASGANNASTGVVETRLPLGGVPEVRLLASEAGLGPDGFSFAVSGPVGALVVVEVSDNLANWTELGVLRLDEGAGTFTDAEAAAAEVRFYRVRLAP